MKANLGLLLFTVVLLSVPASLFGEENLVWRADTYPHPRKQFSLCNYDKPTWVCDPNGLLEKDEADTLNFVLEEIHSKYTSCPCSAFLCEKEPNGYYMTVILAKKIVTGTNVSRPAILSHAMDFVTSLKKRLHFDEDRCDEGIILFYSKDDDILLTYTGKTAHHVLTKDLIEEITIRSGKNFEPNENLSVGLMKMVLHYRQVLNGHYVPVSAALGGETLIGGVRPLSNAYIHIILLTLLAGLISLIGN